MLETQRPPDTGDRPKKALPMHDVTKENFAASLGEIQYYFRSIVKKKFRKIIPEADVDDVVQEAMMDAMRGIKNFRHDSKMSTWLFRIACNRSLMFIRKKRKHSENMAGYQTVEKGIHVSEADPFIGQEWLAEIDDVEKILNKLKPRDKQIVMMRLFEGYLPSEIAAKLKIKKANVNTIYFRALKRLQQIAADEGIVAGM